jgi:hypothetical protein
MFHPIQLSQTQTLPFHWCFLKTHPLSYSNFWNPNFNSSMIFLSTHFDLVNILKPKLDHLIYVFFKTPHFVLLIFCKNPNSTLSCSFPLEPKPMSWIMLFSRPLPSPFYNWLFHVDVLQTCYNILFCLHPCFCPCPNLLLTF